MKRFRVVIGVLGSCVVVGALAVAGCSASAGQTETEQQAPTQQAKAEKHWRGPAVIVIDAAREHGQLSAEQLATLKVIEAELDGQRESRHETRQRLRASAASIVRSGSADPFEMDRALSEVSTTMEARMRASSNALIEVHGILDTEQRNLVADALETQLEERRARHAQRHRHHRQFKRLVKRLALTAAQLAELESVKAEMQAKEQRVKPTRVEVDALIDAFRTDDFPRDLEAFQADKIELMRERLASASEQTDTLLILLVPDQRELLANLIQFGPEALGLHADAEHH